MREKESGSVLTRKKSRLSRSITKESETTDSLSSLKPHSKPQTPLSKFEDDDVPASRKTSGSSAMSTMSVFQFLKEHVLFKDLDDDFLRILENSMQVRVYNDKDYVIKRGEIGRAMFFIRRGTVDAISEDGKSN